MQLLVHPEIFERFPGTRLVVVVAHGIDNQHASPGIATQWRAPWSAASQEGAR